MASCSRPKPTTSIPWTGPTPRQRISHEPVMEVTQVKGDGETHPFLSPNDEFANFERWDVGNIAMPPAPKVKQHAPVRVRTLRAQAWTEAGSQLGVNPYKFGMVGASDQHTGVFSIRDDNYFGQFTVSEPSATRWQTPLLKFADGKVASPSGRNKPRASAPCGRARTPARRSGTHSSARKSMRPRATG